MKRVILSIILFLFSAAVYPIYFKHIGMKEGLSQLSVMSIYQDKLGRMWFGTEEGINMYNGEKIITFNPSESSERKDERASHTLAGNEVWSIVADKEGDLFFRVDNSLMKYDIKKECFSLLKKEGVTSVCSLRGEIWLSINDSIYKWDSKKEQLSFFEKTGLTTTIMRMLWDKNNRLWIATNGGLYLRGKDKVIRCVIPDQEIIALYESTKSEIWVGSRINGLYKIGQDSQVVNYLHDSSNSNTIASNQVREMMEDNQGNLWIGTFRGLNKYNANTGQFTVYVNDNLPGSLSHSSVFSLYKDNQGSIWAGTYYGGVNYFNPGKDIFTYYAESPFKNNCLNFSYVGNMVEDNLGNIWICTEGGGLNRMDRQTRTFTYFKAEDPGTSLKQNNLKCISYDSKRNKLYIGTHTGGLSSYDITRNKFNNYLNDAKLDISYAIIQDMEIYGDKLIFLSRHDLFQLDLNTDQITPLLDRAQNKTVLLGENFKIDSKGYLWLSNLAGLVRINLKNVSDVETFLNGQKGLGKFSALKIVETKDGQIYIGTRGSGLYLFNEKTHTFSRYSKGKNQILSDYCYNIAESDMGHLIITGDKGISFFDREKGLLKQVALGSGLPITSINKGCGLLVCRNGEIFVGGADGLASFFEEGLYRTAKDYQLYFSDLYINNEKVYPNDRHHVLAQALPFVDAIELSYKQNNLIFNFSSNNYISSQKNIFYEYILEGFDPDWTLTDQTTLYYTNLNPGKYILKIREKDINNNDTPREIQLKVVIQKPFYATFWAYLIYFSLGFAIIYMIARFQMSKIKLSGSLELERKDKERIEKLNQSKLLFFTNISHEFKTPLTLIISQIDSLFQNNSLSPSVYNKILKVYKQAYQMRDLINELLDFRKLEQKHVSLKISEQNLVVFLKEIYLSFYEYAQARSISYQFNSDDEKIPCWFDPEQLQKIFYNLLSNAFKYTKQGGRIEVILLQSGNEIIVRVIDTGIGIDSKDLPKIFDQFFQAGNTNELSQANIGTGVGLALSKIITELHHGTISVESRTGYGSIFTVCLKKGNDHFVGDESVTFASQLSKNAIIPESLPDPMFIEQLTESSDNLPKSADGESYKILIVEDNEELLQVLSSLFSPFYSVLLARNGEEGFQKTRDEKPDIVLSDVMMPIMSGTEMCLRIKNDISLCHIPVVLLTALMSAEQNIEGLQRGADDYVGKPFNAKVLLTRCNNLLRNRSLLQKRLTDQSDFDVKLLANNQLDRRFLDRVETIIENHLSDTEFGISELAQELAMSRSSLFAKFKALTGLTPNDFILSNKLKRAAAMLKSNPDFQIAEISDRLGFSSPRYFSRCFKAQFHISPMEYRKES